MTLRVLKPNTIIKKKFTHRTIEARTVITLVQCFDPTITSFNWETTSYTLSCKQLVPICK